MKTFGPISDQPGRFLAVFVFGPMILYKGAKYKDSFLIIFAILLIIWDAYWILFKAPCTNAMIEKDHVPGSLRSAKSSRDLPWRRLAISNCKRPSSYMSCLFNEKTKHVDMKLRA